MKQHKSITLRDPKHLIKHDLGTLQKRATEQFADCISDVSACNDSDRPFLPFAVPCTRLAMYFGVDMCRSTHQSNGIGTAPSHAPSTVPINPP
jgi:hypothetical protein